MSLRERLRALHSIVGTPPVNDTFEKNAVDPRSNIVAWLTAAIDANIPEAHAITLVTVDNQGRPDARVLIIKDIDEQGRIAIATSGSSTKGRQLNENPNVALSWYCTAHARAIRIQGIARPGSRDMSAADFTARSTRAKAIAMAGTQSAQIPAETDRAALIDAKQMEMTKSTGSDDWQVWLIVPDKVEFWQGAEDRNHSRLQYIKREGHWEHATLWP